MSVCISSNANSGTSRPDGSVPRVRGSFHIRVICLTLMFHCEDLYLSHVCRSLPFAQIMWIIRPSVLLSIFTDVLLFSWLSKCFHRRIGYQVSTTIKC